MKENQIGNPTLGDITMFVRKCIGDTELVNYIYNNQDNYKSTVKHWNQVCNNEYEDFYYYFNEQDEYLESVENSEKIEQKRSLINICTDYLEEQKVDFGLNPFIVKLIINTYNRLVSNLGIKECVVVEEYSIEIITKSVLSVMTDLVKESRRKNRKKQTNKLREDLYYSSEFTYRGIGELLLKTCKFKDGRITDINKLIKQFDNSIPQEIIKKRPCKDEDENNYENISDRFSAIINGKSSMSFENLSFIIKWCNENVISGDISYIKKLFIDRYFIDNYFNSLKKVFFIYDELLERIKNQCKNLYAGLEQSDVKKLVDFCNSSNGSKGPTYTIHVLERELILQKEHFYGNNVEWYSKVLETYYHFIESFEGKNMGFSLAYVEFFRYWILARVGVYKEDYEKASEDYRKAFNYKYIVGGFIQQFLREALALEIYLNGTWKKNYDGSKIPLPKRAKYYWNYGRVLKLWSKGAEKAYSINYNRYQQFYIVFPFTNFLFPLSILKKIQIECATENGINLDKNIDTNKIWNDYYDEICNYSTEKQITKRRTFPQAPNDKTENRLYTNFAICLNYGSKDERFLKLAENWIDDIEVDSIMFNNSTALIEALTQFKLIKYDLVQSNIPNILSRYKNLCIKIIEKSTDVTINRATTKNNVVAIQRAIETYDLELVQSIYKRTDKNKKISAFFENPLQYAKVRRNLVSLGLDAFWKKWKERINSVDLEYANIFGFTKTEKRQHIKEFVRQMEIGSEYKQNSFEFYFGKISKKEEHIAELDKIIEFLTSNQ